MNNIFSNAQHIYDYPQFMKLCETTVNNNSSTSFGDDEKFIHFSKLNLQRMDRLNKTFAVDEAIYQQLSTLPQQEWYIITEGWCGDGAQSLPIIAAMADIVENVDVKIILREENPTIMDQFLTNGGKSIPVVAIYENGKLKGKWGPRPQKLQEIFLEMKANNTPFEELEITLQKWYNNDKGQEIMREILSIATKGSL